MNDTERNRTVNWIVTITIGLLVALLVGVFVGFHAAKPGLRKVFGLNGGSVLATPSTTVAYIAWTDGTKTNCTQTVNGILYARPPLSKSNGDKIEWVGALKADTVTVTFDDLGDYGPFASDKYNTRELSSAPTGNPSDYSFKSVMLNGQPCQNYQGMGVHVSN